MRLKSLWIDGFKNLNDFKIDFENRKGITVLIGNNASGKSNILEAISAIFAGFYNDNLQPNFKYELIYQINDKNIRVSSDQKYHFLRFDNDVKITDIQAKDKQKVLGHPVTKHKRNEYLPSQVIALYSGEETRLWEDYYQYFYSQFQRSIKPDNTILTKQKMFYVDSDYWNIALLTLAYSKLENSQDFITNDLGISIENIAFNFKEGIVETKDTNISVEFVKKIYAQCFIEAVTMAKDVNDIFYTKMSLNSLTEVDAGTEKEFFKNILIATNAKNKKYQYIHNINIYFNDGQTVADLSEGQKKQILLKLALEVLADENSLLLFDEPDAHIHISNKKLIPEMLKEYENREIILTTHSPTLAHSFDNKHIAMLGKDDKENAIIIEADKQEIISQLTNDIWSYHEQGLFFNSKDLVLLVEGNSDKKHIEIALDKLKDNYQSLEFSIFSLNSAQNIKSFMNGIKSSVIRDKKKTYIGIFDYDSEGKECSEISDRKKSGTIKKYCKLLKDNEGKNQGVECGYYHMYLPYDDTSKDFKIEQMYSDSRQKEAYEYSIKDMTSDFNAKNIENRAKKYLENNCNTFDLGDFDKFKELFDLILEIKAKK